MTPLSISANRLTISNITPRNSPQRVLISFLRIVKDI